MLIQLDLGMFSAKQVVYVLRLEDDCWYVGYTVNLLNRLNQHCKATGSSWTAMHRPLELYSVEPGDKTRERELTLELMQEHGWRMVRGAAWTAHNLADAPVCLR